MSFIYDDSKVLENIAVEFDYGDLDVEVNDHYIDAARCFIDKMDEILYILLKKEQDGRAQVKTAVWALAFALGSKHLEGKSMTEVAERLDITRAAMSKQTVLFSKTLNLPASPYMAPSRKSYGKETAFKKASRLAESVIDREYGIGVVEITQDIIRNNIARFKECRSKGPRVRECWGSYNRSKEGRIISVFIKNQYIEKMFNGKSTKKAIVKSWIDSGALMKSGMSGGQRNKSILRGIDGEVYRGYVIRYDNIVNKKDNV